MKNTLLYKIIGEIILNKKLFLILESAGAVIVFIITIFLHFLYDLYPTSLTALLGSVNESIWEHMKIFAIAYVVYGFTELLWARPNLKRFAVAKAMGLYVMVLVIPAIYYSYTFFIRKPFLIIDLLTGLLSTGLGFFVSYKLFSSSRKIEKYFYTSIMMLFLMLMAVVCFTFYPPQTELFRDVVTSTFGIPDKNMDMGAFALEKLKNVDIF